MNPKIHLKCYSLYRYLKRNSLYRYETFFLRFDTNRKILFSFFNVNTNRRILTTMVLRFKWDNSVNWRIHMDGGLGQGTSKHAFVFIPFSSLSSKHAKFIVSLSSCFSWFCYLVCLGGGNWIRKPKIEGWLVKQNSSNHSY